MKLFFRPRGFFSLRTIKPLLVPILVVVHFHSVSLETSDQGDNVPNILLQSWTFLVQPCVSNSGIFLSSDAVSPPFLCVESSYGTAVRAENTTREAGTSGQSAITSTFPLCVIESLHVAVRAMKFTGTVSSGSTGSN